MTASPCLTQPALPIAEGIAAPLIARLPYQDVISPSIGSSRASPTGWEARNSSISDDVKA